MQPCQMGLPNPKDPTGHVGTPIHSPTPSRTGLLTHSDALAGVIEKMQMAGIELQIHRVA